MLRAARTSTTATARSSPSSSTAPCGAAPPRRPARPGASSGPLARLDPPVRAALRLGAYQLLHGMPPHAAVARPSTRSRRARRARGLRQRRAARARTRLAAAVARAGDDDARSARLVPRLDRRSASSTSSAPTTRSRTLELENEPRGGHAARRTRAGSTAERARRRARARRASRSSRARSCPTRCSCAASAISARSPAVRDGRATPQDQASQAVVAVLDPQPGERVARPRRRARRQGHRDRRAHGRRRLGRRRRRRRRARAHDRRAPRRRHRAAASCCPVVGRRPRDRRSRRRVRPRAARRAVQRPRRAAPPARRPLARCSPSDDRRARRAAARAARGRGRAGAARRRARLLGVHAHRDGDVGVDDVGRARSCPSFDALAAAGRAVAPARPRRAAAPAGRRHRRHVRPRPRAPPDSGRGGSVPSRAR